MSQIDQRIAQWEKMAAEAPDDMAYFSLGNAYRDAERFEDAADAYRKALEMNEQMSRAYQMFGQVLIQLDKKEEAAEVLTKGYEIAATRGDVMPMRAIGSLLEQKLGKPLPKVETAQSETPAVPLDDENTIVDRRTGQPQRKLDGPPMRGPLGQLIYENFGQETWNAWIGQGTKVINELRLDFSNEQHGEVYEQHMLEWLEISSEELDAYRKKQS